MNGIVGAIVEQMKWPAGFAIALIACGSKAPSKIDGAPTRPPDESYEVGGALADRVLVWKCDERNERIAMVQNCAEGLTGCGAWRVSRTLCPADPAGREATRAPLEAGIPADGHHPIPEGSGWR